MVDVRPFCSLRPARGLEERVVSPPYDVVSTAEARAWAATFTWDRCADEAHAVLERAVGAVPSPAPRAAVRGAVGAI